MNYPARYYEEIYRYQLRCHLCPHLCTIGDGKTGICRVRKNVQGALFLQTYGEVSSMGFDPIEKKPLYHFYPGSIIFSVGSYGCNLRCKFCQNSEISQDVPREFTAGRHYPPEEIVALAGEKKSNIGIAFTYNEPTVWFEYMMDIARLSRKAKMKNVVVTNGFISKEPLAELIEVTDAFNVDLKAFTEDFYLTQTMSKLEPVKESLLQIRRSGRHLEITNLVIPTRNDDKAIFEEMIRWIREVLGSDTVLHLSRYFPTYKMSEPPTPVETLQDLYALASAHLQYVYVGNSSGGDSSNTYCPSCHRKVIDRSRYDAWPTGLTKTGQCSHCGHQVLNHI